MSRALRLYNTFTRKLNSVQIGGKQVSPNSYGHTLNGSLYICGPTVYSDCHLGHALTYIRADLLRRFMKSVFNVRLLTVMNITDVDDKILEKCTHEFGPSSDQDPSTHPFNKIGDRYYKSFLDDLASIRVLPADLYVKVSKNVPKIISFIQTLERTGHAYVASNGDVHFRVQSVKGYVGRVDSRITTMNDAKHDQRDFVLWKVSKPHEPAWAYVSPTSNRTIMGRPGWHVQCSTISSSVFGSQLDIHFGGKDLIFPHHYNEEACSCAYHQLDTSDSMHVWSKNWLHSGHLIMKEEKMSKSLGNTISIKSFTDRTSVNALRILCVMCHYRSDFEFSNELIERVKAVEHRMNAFISFLREALKSIQNHEGAYGAKQEADSELSQAIELANQNIIDAICDDFHLDRALESIFDLSKFLYSRGAENLDAISLMSCFAMMKEWCQTCGIESELMTGSNECTIELLQEFRDKVRHWALKEISSAKASQDMDRKQSLGRLMGHCDDVRSRMNELGLVSKDDKA